MASLYDQINKNKAAQAGIKYLGGNSDQLNEEGNDLALEQQRRRQALQEVSRPDLVSAADANGNLKSNYQVGQIGPLQSNLSELDKRASGINLNTQGLEEIRKRALSQGPSQWAQMAESKQRMEQGQQKNQAAAQSASGLAQAQSGLAMRGGLQSGARAGLAKSAMRDRLMANQGVGAQGELARANIGLQDNQNQTALLTQLPGMENQALEPGFKKLSAWQQMAQGEQNNNLDLSKANAQIQSGNIANQLAQQTQKNQFNMNQYQEQMRNQAGERQAQATERAGKK